MTDSLDPSGGRPDAAPAPDSKTDSNAGPATEPRRAVREARAAFRVIPGGRDARPAGEATGEAGPDPADAPSPRRRRRFARSAAEPGPEEVADAALLLLTSVRGAEDAARVAERLAAEVDPRALAPALAALADRVALLERAARRRPLPV